jgi:hypothetical protein
VENDRTIYYILILYTCCFFGETAAFPLMAVANGSYLALPGPLQAMVQAYAHDVDETLPMEPDHTAAASEPFSLALPDEEVEIPPTQPDMPEEPEVWVG